VTRISRISTPRATLAAFALLIVVMTGSGLFVDGADGVLAEGGLAESVLAEGRRAANETEEQPANETLQTCSLPSHVPPEARFLQVEDDSDVYV